MSTTPGVAVVGCGYWGKNLVRNFHQLGALRAVCDATESGRARARELAPGAKLCDSVEELLRLPEIAGVALATPAVTHLPLALQCLAAGRDVFVEKPMSLRSEEGREMLAAARAGHRVLMVGHILEYHPAILALRGLIDAGKLGRIRYIYSNRLNFGKIRTEENALWSFAPHDVAVILRLVGALPEEVSCRGAAFVHGHLADVTVSTLHFPENIHAHIFVSWLNPFKEQKLVVVGEERMAVFNDMAKEEKLLLYNQHVTVENGLPVLHNQDIEAVPVAAGEPLTAECADFLHCIATRSAPLSGGETGLRVLQVLEACQKSMDLHGRGVRLKKI
ncbi:MAG: Gfo/Idh/MocA family oxidoreductase [Pedosphaera sp.]|nr:Gfo/Idh/MocA family oxidoreductase [Pedosphaera sp.]